MKKILLSICLAVVVMMASCGTDEPVNPQQQPESQSTSNPLSGTTWTGYYDTPVSSAATGEFLMRVDWTLDFMNDSIVSLLAEITSQVSEPQYQDIDCQYTIEGSLGHIYSVGSEDTFQYDSINQTITMDMQMQANLGEEFGGMVMLGGVTTLYRTR